MFGKADRAEVSKHTKSNREEVLASDTCGCLSCCCTFAPDEIKEWTDEVDRDRAQEGLDRTAICPHCGDAMIIGDHSGYQVSRTFLEAMRMR